MKITNTSNTVVGLDGYINLKPGVPVIVQETPDNIDRASRLQKAGLVKVEFDTLPEAPTPAPTLDKVAAPEEAPVVDSKDVVPDTEVDTNASVEATQDKSVSKKSRTKA